MTKLSNFVISFTKWKMWNSSAARCGRSGEIGNIKNLRNMIQSVTSYQSSCCGGWGIFDIFLKVLRVLTLKEVNGGNQKNDTMNNKTFTTCTPQWTKNNHRTTRQPPQPRPLHDTQPHVHDPHPHAVPVVFFKTQLEKGQVKSSCTRVGRSRKKRVFRTSRLCFVSWTGMGLTFSNQDVENVREWQCTWEPREVWSHNLEPFRAWRTFSLRKLSSTHKSATRVISGMPRFLGCCTNVTLPGVSVSWKCQKIPHWIQGDTSFQNTLFTGTEITLNCEVLFTLSKQATSDYFCLGGWHLLLFEVVERVLLFFP